MLGVMESIHGKEFDQIPAVYEDRSISAEQVEDAKLIGYTENDHVILKLADGSITIVYSIDIDWLLYDEAEDKISD